MFLRGKQLELDKAKDEHTSEINLNIQLPMIANQGRNLRRPIRKYSTWIPLTSTTKAPSETS